MSEMTERSEPEQGEPRTGDGAQGIAPRAAAPLDRLLAGRPPDRRHQRRWVPVTAALLSLLVGLAYIVEGLRSGPVYNHLKHSLHKLNEVAPGVLSLFPRVADVIVGMLLLMFAHALRRRKKRAWQGVMLLLAFSVIVHAVRAIAHASLPDGDHFVAVAGAAILLVLLWIYRSEFYATGDPRTRWRAVWAFFGLVVADIIIGFAYISVGGGLQADYTPAERLQSAIYNLIGFNGPVHFVTETRADLYGVVMGGLGLLTVVVAGFLFLRPARREGRLGAQDAARIRELLDKYGERDSLGYFTLRTDKSVIWSPTGKSCIGYRVLSGVMLASGDPLGDPEAWPGAINAFLDRAARHAWAPAVIGCSELGAEVWCRTGDLTALELGDEAVVSVADFSLQGRQMRNVRQMVTRVCRAGYVAQLRRVGDVPPDELARLVRQADSWRGTPTERGFSMALGRIGAPGDERCMIATATQDGVLKALLHFVPWGTDGLSLDLMRRDRSAQPGLNDFMIVETIKVAQDLGVRRISLNFAAFRAALERGERIGAGPITRAWRRFLLFLSRWFQIESLYKFNAKFCPEWVPRFMVFPGPSDAVRIGIASLEAEAFLVWPTVELRRIRRKLRGAFQVRRPVAARATEAAPSPGGPD